MVAIAVAAEGDTSARRTAFPKDMMQRSREIGVRFLLFGARNAYVRSLRLAAIRLSWFFVLVSPQRNFLL